MLNIFGLTCDQLTACLDNTYQKGAYHAAALYRTVFQKGITSLDVIPEFQVSARFAARLAPNLDWYCGRIVDAVTAEGVTKYVIRLDDQNEVEAVYVPMANHNTLCISSQVGCRMACRFCQTGKLGFRRDLTVAEIVGQVYLIRTTLGRPIRNVVFMGMGEPLDNIETVIQAIRVMSDQRGLDIAKKNISISTVGLKTGIEHLIKLNWPALKLAVSLNAPNDALRSQLMPINRSIGLAPLRDVLQNVPLKRDNYLFLAYVLIKGVNDQPEHAAQLADYVKPLKYKLNVIGFNPTPNVDFQEPSMADIDRFCDYLIAENIFVRRRKSKGKAVWAACGQLGRAV